MREAWRVAGAAMLAAAAVWALLATLPGVRTWGSASAVGGTPAVVSAQDAVGVISVRVLLTLVSTGLLLLAAGARRPQR